MQPWTVECISISELCLRQICPVANELYSLWKSRQLHHIKRWVECSRIACHSFLPISAQTSCKKANTSMASSSALFSLCWWFMCHIFSCPPMPRYNPSSEPVQRHCPEHRGIPAVPVGRRVSGLHWKQSFVTTANKQQEYNLWMAIHLHTQIWTG